jgi:hypothetical protein
VDCSHQFRRCRLKCISTSSSHNPSCCSLPVTAESLSAFSTCHDGPWRRKTSSYMRPVVRAVHRPVS